MNNVPTVNDVMGKTSAGDTDKKCVDWCPLLGTSIEGVSVAAEKVKKTLAEIKDNLVAPEVLLRQQMDAVIRKVATEDCVQCRFEVETKDDKTIVTRYEFIPKKTPNTNNSRRDLGPICFLILILVIGFFLVCWRTAIQEVSVSRTTNCSKVIAGGQNPSGCSNVVEQSSFTTNQVSCWPWK